MHSKMTNLINIILIFFIFNLTLCSDPKLEGEYLNQFQEHKTYEFQTKLAACLNLITHSLRGPDGNIYLHKAIKNTKLDRNKFYEKYTIALITQCINNINQGQLEFLLTGENVDAYDTKNATLLNLIKLNYEITTVQLTEEENEVKKVIDEIMEKNDKSKKKKSFIDSFLDYGTLLKIASFAIPFLLFFCFQSRRMLNPPAKKELDENTKELLDLIKQKGKKSPNYKETTEDNKEKKDGKKKTE